MNPFSPSAANGCSLHAVAAGGHPHLSVHHSMSEYEQEEKSEVLKSDEGHTQTHVVYELHI